MNLHVEAVDYTYPGGARALQGVSLKIPSGTWLALVGENGAGKTTLARLLCGLLRPDAGRVWVGDWDTRAHTAAQLARRVSYVFQNPDDQLFERSVGAEVAFGPRNLSLPSHEVEARVQASLQALRLEALQSRHPYELTPALRKFVALAAADAMQAPILILDEPTTGLDGPGQELLKDYLMAKRREGRSVLAISHDMDFVAEMFEHVIVMSEGMVLADGTAGEVFRQIDLLGDHQLEPPQLVRLAAALAWSETPLTIEAFVDQFAALRQRKDTAS
jgi:energy-coupling factor transport system ATP-binding protein